MNEHDKLLADHKDAFATFVILWCALPPLVRANVASLIVEYMERSTLQLHREQLMQLRLGLPRREAVTTKLREGCELVQTLFAAFTNFADDEAVQRGIDVDTGEHRG